MWLPTPIYERIPQFWFLLGLLFNAAGLYLGFEFTLSFWYMMIGWFCCAYSVGIFVLRLSDRPRTKAAAEPQTPIEFVSGEPMVSVPSDEMTEDDNVPEMEQPGSE